MFLLSIISFFPLAVINLVIANHTKITIGRVEWVELPEFNLKLEARIDTGARNCSLHAFNQKEIELDGTKYIEFTTHDAQKKKVKLKAKVAKIKTIKSPGGYSARRYVIKTKVALGKEVREVYITLNDRSNMEYPFLVGRNLLRGKFVVDVSHSHLLDK
ncbi:MAG: RimK/LysX family protein [Spirochaetes bacterium]|nr:RimK/LysX family protein [Spirochaetota bacterium]